METLKGEAGKFRHRCIPVFIELKRFRGPEVNIKDVIVVL